MRGRGDKAKVVLLAAEQEKKIEADFNRACSLFQTTATVSLLALLAVLVFVTIATIR